MCLINWFGCFCRKHANTLKKGSVQSAWRNAVMPETHLQEPAKSPCVTNKSYPPSSEL